MSRCITLAMVAFLAAGPALAGGFPTPIVTPAVTPPPVVPITPVIVTNDWSGGYAGAQLGFGRFTSGGTFEEDGEDVEFEDFEGNGALFGVHAGYMFDLGSIVLGAELDYDRTQIDIDPTAELLSWFGPVDGDIGQIDSIARAKLRLGYDAGRFMPYVTGGLARMTMDFEDEFEAGFLGEFDDTYDGRFFGLGASYMASGRLMVSVEALRHNFEDAPVQVDEDAQDVGYGTVLDTVTLRGSFHF